MKSSVNLLPLQHRRTATAQRVVMPWLAVCVGLVLVGGYLWWNMQSSLDVVERQLDRMRQQHAPMIAMRERLTAVEQEAASKKALVATLNQFRNDVPPWLPLGLVSRNSKELGGAVALEQLTLTEPTELFGASKNQAATSVLQLRGSGKDNYAVAQFISSLRQSGAFAQVELKSAVTQASDGNSQNCAYVIVCEL